MRGSGLWRMAVVAVVLAVGVPALAVDIETVPVGNPGNADDTHGDGYGGVDYTYNMGKYEVTAGQYTEFLNAVAATDTYDLYNTSMDYDANPSTEGCNIKRTGSSGSHVYSVASDWANRPVNYVSWSDAARFANWVANGQPTGEQDLTTTEDGSYYLNGATYVELLAVARDPDATWVIPSEDEWYKAAYHKNDGVTGNYFDFSTSSDSTPSYVVATPDPGNNANYWDMFGTGNYSIGSPYWRTEVGEFENSESPYDTFDQGGNVVEWNETADGPFRGLSGGAFMAPILGALGAGVYTSLVDQESYLGFRVALVPEPASLALLAFGGVGVLIRRKGIW